MSGARFRTMRNFSVLSGFFSMMGSGTQRNLMNAGLIKS